MSDQMFHRISLSHHSAAPVEYELFSFGTFFIIDDDDDARITLNAQHTA